MSSQATGIPGSISSSQSVARSAGVTSIAVLASRITGLVREIALAHYFGATAAKGDWHPAFRDKTLSIARGERGFLQEIPPRATPPGQRWRGHRQLIRLNYALGGHWGWPRLSRVSQPSLAVEFPSTAHVIEKEPDSPFPGEDAWKKQRDSFQKYRERFKGKMSRSFGV